VFFPNYISIIKKFGGVEFYSENIIRGTDVTCSVYNRTDLYCTGCSVPFLPIVENPN
jgi:hypothetical protein